MDSSKRHSPKGSFIWKKLMGFSHCVYHFVGNSFLGRSLTSYRRADALLHHDRRRTLRDDCRPMSPARLKLLEAVHQGGIFRILGGLFSLAAYAPAVFYGLCGLFYGVLGAAVHMVEAMVRADVTINVPRLILFAVIVLLSVPLLFSKKPVIQLLVTGKLTRWLTVGWLGLPEEQLSRPKKQRVGVSIVPYVAMMLATVCAVVTLWIHPLIIPGVLGILAVVAMIFAFPETGVVLSVTVLPLVWWNKQILLAAILLILLTWMGYGVKLLFMQRTLRFNLLDVSVLIFGVTLCLGGLTGGYVTVESVCKGLGMLVLLSLYFLITNLMTSRDQLRHCLIGPCLVLLLAMGISVIRAIPADLLNWLGGSLGGDFLVNGFLGIKMFTNQMAYQENICILLMAVPFLCAMLMRKKRALNHIMVLVAMGGCFVCLYLIGAKAALVAALIGTLLYFLLFSYRSLAAGILSLPALVCGGTWLFTVFHERIQGAITRMVAGQLHRESLWRGAWRLVCDHPAGIGLGDKAFEATYPLYAEAGLAHATDVASIYLTLLVRIGVPGLIVFAVMVFLFIQKTFTCLKVSERREDTAKILGGMMSILSLLIYGFVSSAPASVPVFFMAFISLALCSTYENMIFAEWDRVTVGMTGNDRSADIIIHP